MRINIEIDATPKEIAELLQAIASSEEQNEELKNFKLAQIIHNPSSINSSEKIDVTDRSVLESEGRIGSNVQL